MGGCWPFEDEQTSYSHCRQNLMESRTVPFIPFTVARGALGVLAERGGTISKEQEHNNLISCRLCLEPDWSRPGQISGGRREEEQDERENSRVSMTPLSKIKAIFLNVCMTATCRRCVR